VKKTIGSILLIFGFSSLFYCTKPNTQSEQLYSKNCGSCHLGTGEGVGGLVPSLIDTQLFEQNRTELICITKNGIVTDDGSGFTYAMPANKDLSDTEITNILNYIRNQWHKETQVFSIREIQKTLSSCN